MTCADEREREEKTSHAVIIAIAGAGKSPPRITQNFLCKYLMWEIPTAMWVRLLQYSHTRVPKSTLVPGGQPITKRLGPHSVHAGRLYHISISN